MKTTLELPDELVRRLERRTARGGRKLDEVAADMLAATLSSEPVSGQPAEIISKHLPVVKGHSYSSADARSMTAQQMCDWIKDVELEQEVERHESSLGHQYVDRGVAIYFGMNAMWN